MKTAISTPCDAKQLIDGEWQSSGSPGIANVNPATQEVIGHIPFATLDQIDKAISAAAHAFPNWRETPASIRARILFRAQKLLFDHHDELAELISREQGKTLEDARGEILEG